MAPRRIFWPLAAAVTLLGLGPLHAGGGQDRLRLRELLKDRAADLWIYDDLEEGTARARKSGKPLLVSFRCVP